MTALSHSWSVALKRALAAHADEPQARLVQLATVRPDGLPGCRTMAFRGLLEPFGRLQFTTDLRSTKIRQLEKLDWAEACWYFPLTREQFRLLGSIHVVGPDDPDPTLVQARLEAWRGLPDETRLTFAGQAPGTPLAQPGPAAVKVHDLASPFPNFGLLLLDPGQVDHLQLASSPHDRRVYTRDAAGNWSSRAINP
jgi:pyridoxamine 5'-phosphate oxidase